MIEQLENITKITIQNNLTINFAADLHRLLMKGLKSDKDLLIAISESSPVDVTFLQIFHSFIAQCEIVNKRVFFETNGNSELISALARMGYYDISGVLESVEPKMEG